MIRRIAWTGLILVVLVGVIVGLSLITPSRRPATSAVQLPQTSRITCVPAGELQVIADSDVYTGAAGQEEGEAQQSPVKAKISDPTVVRANGLAAAGVLLGSGVRGWVPCETPASSGMLLVADPAATELVLVNTDQTEAAVDLNLYGPDGEISAVGARGIAIAPGVTRRIALSVLAAEAGDGPVAVAFTSAPGRVAVLGTAIEASSEKHYATASAVATEQVIAGIPAGSKKQKLLLSNPGISRVAVEVTALGESGTYRPASAADVVIEPLSSVEVDLGSDLDGEATAIKVTAPGEVGAAVVLDDQTGPPVTLTAATAGEELASPAAEGWVVALTNPGVETVEAKVVGAEDEKVIVRAGMSVTVPVAKGATEVRVSAEGPLMGALTSGTSKGLIVAPLLPVGVTAEVGRDASYDSFLR